MSATDVQLFQLLKEEIAQTFLSEHSASSHRIQEWKGQDIVDFQEDLLEKVKGQISEKWFYTHIKGDTGKLPRVDMLNLLSAYADYENWAAFRNHHAGTLEVAVPPEKPVKRKKTGAIVAAVVAFITAFVVVLLPGGKETYQFCFEDADQGTAITGEAIEVLLLKEGQSPVVVAADSSGCVQLPYEEGELKFVVRSAYYNPDTITRMGDQPGREVVKLRTNDYALMIHIFSNSKVEDWAKRRKQLNNMFADNAQVVQIDKTARIAIELFDKQEFIDKLTMPVNSLKNIEVLETIYQDNQIVKLRFTQKGEG